MKSLIQNFGCTSTMEKIHRTPLKLEFLRVSEIALQNTMMETNALLTAREHRLEAEWDEAEARHDLNSIQEIEGLIAETRGLRYNL